MNPTSIYRTPLGAFKAVAWKNQAVYKQYPKLKNYLKQQLGEDMASFLAEPHITEADWQGISTASWTSEVITGEPVPLSKLAPERERVMRERLREQMGALQDFSQQQLESEDPGNNSWGQLINKALQVPDEQYILTDGERVVLVCWGLEYQRISEGEFNLRKEFPGIAGAAEVWKSKMEGPLVVPEPEVVAEPAEVAEEPAVAETPGVTEAPVVPEPTVSLGTVVPPIPPVVVVSGSRRPWWRSWWWLWLLLLLLLLLLLFYKGCRRGAPLLPPQAGILVPIDTTKLVSAPDSVRIIVSDRLNVALTGANKDIYAFARRFRELYPGSQYTIIYYDTVTSRLQLEVPAAEREKIAGELPAKLPEFELLIWEEGMFQQNNRPSDPGFSIARECWYHLEVQAFDAWNVTRGDNKLVIAVIDDGFDLAHKEFQGKVVAPWNVPDHSVRVTTTGVFHGTHVAGIALGAADNNAGVAGIAPNCLLMPVQVGDRNGKLSTTAIIDGFLYAIGHGAKVINISLGLEASASAKRLSPEQQRQVINTRFKGEEKFWDNLFHTAYKKNIVVVVAAGNQDLLVGLDPMERSRYAIKVSAVGPDQRKADFSNYGSLSTLSAPGTDIYSSLPGNRFGFLDGTSMASPIVAGGVALIKSANPALTYDQIVDLLQSTGIPAISPGRPIGNIIQLGKALGIAEKGGQRLPKVGCPDAQQQIDSLLQEIEKIKRSCGAVATGDTLRIPPHAKDLRFAVGRWKSTTYIYDIRTGEPVTIYFDFLDNGHGGLTLVQHDNSTCTSPLSLALRSETFYIDQLERAVCGPTNYFSPYSFVCHPDSSGCAVCEAKNKEDPGNHLRFNLVKVN